jgi:pimeloyl-ACP methyl ester carboxylesterase
MNLGYRTCLASAGKLTTLLSIVFIWVFSIVSPAVAQTGSTSGRPILFTHGFYGDSPGWGNASNPASFRGFVISSLEVFDGTDYSNNANYDLYFDLQTGSVLWDKYGNPAKDPPAVGNIPTNARFFTIVFNSWNASNLFDKYAVANVSILNKAYELSQVIKAITQITRVQDVIIIGHSQGGLVARTYVEGLGSLFPCVDTSYAPPCEPGQVQYTSDVAHILSLDTPHGGGDFTDLWVDFFLLGQVPPTPPLNLNELQAGSSVIQALNYDAQIGHASAISLPSALTIDSIESYFSDLPYTCPGSDSLCYSDAVVDSNSQAIRQNINPNQLSPQLTDIGNGIASTDPQIQALEPLNCPPDPLIGSTGAWLHLISCTGGTTYTQNDTFDSISTHLQGNFTSINVQATYNGNPWTGNMSYRINGPSVTQNESSVPSSIADIPVGTYSLVYLSGGPPSNGPPSIIASPSPTIQSGQWTITFTVQFSSGASSGVMTKPASAITSSAALLNGTVNPKSSTGAVYFYWGTDPTMTAYSSYWAGNVVANGGTQSFSTQLSGLLTSTTYYFQTVFYNSSSGTYQYGAVLDFATLSTTTVTKAASIITSSAALLNGTVNPNSSTGSVYFYWGTDPTMTVYSSYWAGNVVANGTTQSFSTQLSGLLTSTTYYFQTVFYNSSSGTYQYGTVLNFATLLTATVTKAASVITSSAALLNGTVNPNSSTGAVYFYWGTDPTMTVYSSYWAGNVVANGKTQSFSTQLSGLLASTNYYFQTVFYNSSSGTYQFGAVLKLKTLSTTTATKAASAITSSAATLNGTVNPNSSTGAVYFYWGTDPTMTVYSSYWAGNVVANGSTQVFSTQLSGLTTSTTYYFKTVFYNSSNGTYQYGAVLNFKTLPTTTQTNAATSITSSGATLKGTVNPNSSTGAVYFYWGTDPTMIIYSSYWAGNVVANNNAQSFSTQLSGLAASTTYYFETVFYNSSNGSYQYGGVLNFTTQ